MYLNATPRMQDAYPIDLLPPFTLHLKYSSCPLLYYALEGGIPPASFSFSGVYGVLGGY
jgi:hypothetical protein